MRPSLCALTVLALAVLALLCPACAANDPASSQDTSTDTTHTPDPDALADTSTDADADDSDAQTDAQTDTPTDAATTPQTCSAQEKPPLRAVISRLVFTRELASGVADGLDLDGVTTLPGDSTGCRKPDFTSPDGSPGIDNQFVTLLPAFEAVGGEEGVESAIQRAIQEGGVLIVVELEGLDDTTADACVAAQFSRADGRPSLGADGQLEPSQTLDRYPDHTPSRVPNSAVVDGVITLGPVNLTLPMHVSGYDILLTFHDTMLRFSIADDGSLHGLLAGSLSLDELFTVLDQIEDGTALLVTIRRVLSGAADLAPDPSGRCQRMSVALHFDATPIFYFD